MEKGNCAEFFLSLLNKLNFSISADLDFFQV